MHEKEQNDTKQEGKTVETLINYYLPEKEKSLVDAYFNNGFNKVLAAKEVRPELDYTSASTWANRAFKDLRVKDYIREKQAVLRQETNIENVQILQELLIFAYSDVTTFIGLGPDDIKALPPEVRRCIASIDTETKTWLDPKDKSIIKQVNVKIKLVDKLKAIDMISKHIDFFNADNRSKSGTIDLTRATDEQLNTVLDLINSQKKIG